MRLLYSGYEFLADSVMVIHFAYVAFVVVGLALIWLGFLCSWRWVRNFWFRAVHLLTMGIVVVEALFKITCPLTTWERALRRKAGVEASDGSFVKHWVHKLMFWDLEPSTFTIIYVVFFLGIVLSLVFVRVRWPFNRE